MNSLQRNAAWTALILAFSTCITLLLYTPALSLPFYSDDLLQVQWVKTTPLMDLWRTASPYGDYRPLHFTLWRLVYLLAGDLRPWTLHALNLAGAIVSGALLGAFALQARRSSTAAALLAVGLFAAFPFAFDVVPWAVSFSYPLVVALSLGAVLLYVQARRSGSAWAYGGALALTVSAGLAYEPGIVTGFLILLAEATLTERRDYRRATLYVAVSLLPLLAIFAFAGGESRIHVALPSAQDVGIGLQALAYPVAPLATLLARAGAHETLALAAVALPTLAILIVAAHRARRLPLFLFGLIWSLVWTVLPLVTQQFDWLRDPPRVLYPSAACTALAWAVGLASLTPQRWRISRYAGAAILGAAAVLPAALFVRSTVQLYADTGEFLWEVVRETERHPDALFVNLPSRITLPDCFYPLGHEGFIPMPPPSNASLLAEVNGGIPNEASERSLGAVLPSLSYGVELAGPPLSPDDVRAAGRVFLAEYDARGVALSEAGRVMPSESASQPLARFDDSLLLLSCSCEPRPGGIVLTTRWMLSQPVPGTPTVFAHLLGPDGSLIAQADGDPLRGLFPLAQWAQGEVVEDIRTFEAAGDGPLTVAFGIWDPTSGERWHATSASGEALADNAFRCAFSQE